MATPVVCQRLGELVGYAIGEVDGEVYEIWDCSFLRIHLVLDFESASRLNLVVRRNYVCPRWAKVSLLASLFRTRQGYNLVILCEGTSNLPKSVALSWARSWRYG